MRKMARVETIQSISPIQGADKIELLKVGGWQVVTQKGLYSAGDKVIYCEIDAFIPESIAPFLTKGSGAKVYNGVSGNVLRTIRLRGEYSQGLVLPLGESEQNCPDGHDLSESLGITKYEKPLPEHLTGLCRGNFPSNVQKTDQDRVQNIFHNGLIQGKTYQVEEKLDGSSMTVVYDNGVYSVCSRNLSLKLDQEGNAFINAARAANALEALTAYGVNIALQGELISGNIQGGRYHPQTEWYIFDIYSIDNQRYLNPVEREGALHALKQLGLKVKEVPIVLTHFTMTDETLEEFLQYAEGISNINPKIEREGVVLKETTHTHGRPAVTFKVISNKWLLKNE